MYNTKTLNNCQIEVDKDFSPRRRQAEKLSLCYDALGERFRAERVDRCGTFLEFQLTEEEAKLHSANFCKDRLCPMCNWRRSKKIFAQVSACMDHVERDGFRFIFLTLTVKNCPFSELSETISALLNGWKSLYRKRDFQKRVCGSFRTLEITVNRKTCTFHPHLHVILVVKPSYFSGKDYLSTQKWAELWQKSCSLDYVPVVHVEAVKSGKLDAVEALQKDRSFRSAVKEVSKYVAKGSDYLDGEFEEMLLRVSHLLDALAGRRLCSFTGVLKDAAAQLRLDDMEDGDLVHTETEVRSDVACVVVRYMWRSGVYEREVVET